jgi:hypothetical protein
VSHDEKSFPKCLLLRHTSVQDRCIRPPQHVLHIPCLVVKQATKISNKKVVEKNCRCNISPLGPGDDEYLNNMPLAMEWMPPKLVVHATGPRRAQEKTGICDLAWACILNDYLDNDNTELSDDGQLRSERRKMRKLKRQEKKLRAKLADKFRTTPDIDERDGVADPIDGRTLSSDVEGLVGDSDAFDSDRIDVEDPVTDDHEQLGSKPSSLSGEQREQRVELDDPPRLHDTLGSNTLLPSHLLPVSRERSFSNHEKRARILAIAEKLGQAHSAHERLGSPWSVRDKETLRLTNESGDKSRSTHEKRGKVLLEPREEYTKIQPPGFLASEIATKKAQNRAGLQSRGANTGDVPEKRVQPERVETMPSRSPVKSIVRPPRPPKPDERMFTQKALLQVGSLDNPIDIENEWNARTKLLIGKKMRQRRITKSIPNGNSDVPVDIPEDDAATYHYSRRELLTAKPSMNRASRPKIASPYPLHEGTGHDDNTWGLGENSDNDIRRKKLDRKAAIHRIRAIKAKIALLDPNEMGSDKRAIG